MKSYSSEDLYRMNLDYFKRLDDSYKPWKLIFWKQRFLYGYWLVILTLCILVFIYGVMTT